MKRHHQKSDKPHHGKKHGRGLDGLDDIEAMSEILEQFVDGPMFGFEFEPMQEVNAATCDIKNAKKCGATDGCSWCTMQELPVGSCKTAKEAEKLSKYHKFSCSSDSFVDRFVDRAQDHMESPPAFWTKFLPREEMPEQRHHHQREDEEGEDEEKPRHH